jgi:16S rRNA (cytosine1402-N4)-methyltransferase
MHIPVLVKEVLEYLSPQSNENFIDCTFGNGGHSLEILKMIKPNGKILGIEWDEEIIKRLGDNDKRLVFGENLILINDNYANLQNIVQEKNFFPANGILFDLGMSSWDIEKSGRGFSFQKDEPLDMRYSAEQELTAEEIINKWPEEKLAEIFYKYGEERRARAIAKRIVVSREKKPIETTMDLTEIIQKAMPARQRLGAGMAGGPTRLIFNRIHPATRVFQAIRIAVNNELNNLEKGLAAALEILAPGGRMAVISFHSLEDRIVKNFFRDKKYSGELEILTKKPVVASAGEILENPRSRSAKLRAARKLTN